MDIFIGTTLEMTEISFFFFRKLHQHLHGQGRIPGLHFLFCGSMRTREMMGFLGIGNNPMVGCTVACAVDVAQALAK